MVSSKNFLMKLLKEEINSGTARKLLKSHSNDSTDDYFMT